MKRKYISIIMCLLIMVSSLSGCAMINEVQNNLESETTTSISQATYIKGLDSLPEYNGEPYVIINDNIPEFKEADITTSSFESYGELDYLGRCTTCMACIGADLMPTQERGEIGSVKPTGWHTVKYDNVDGKYLYNRCHLIGYQLTAENANPNNLITGTRYLNIDGMLDFENLVADYIKSTGNHVLYRVTPIFMDNELVARGVQMEGYSVEDSGKGVSYNIYCFNAQPDIKINYATGDSEYIGNSTTIKDGEKQTYYVNISTKKYHKKNCSSLSHAKSKNIKLYKGTKEQLANNGYSPCKSCNP